MHEDTVQILDIEKKIHKEESLKTFVFRGNLKVSTINTLEFIIQFGERQKFANLKISCYSHVG